ncbi:leucyl aminopeptidase [Salinisphaera sp. P385]|uniref:Probable cytosol aminopeptidase n=1 Tax=Spectribacter acetivorans TaxID=3075603 RepID=A0ABU3B5J2_9GAMM|nr:leucyl aminopeptidase [Salinisphaera sp. P385]MDT0617710.1 leucyl aminopeptidase [Salinisphaera sp. P385]
MEYLVKSGSPEKQRVGCVVVGVFDRRKPSPQAQALDDAGNGLIGSVMRRGDMDGKLGQTTMLHGLDDMLCDRILLVGCGRQQDFDQAAYRKACRAAARELDRVGGVDAAHYLPELNVKALDDIGWTVKQALLVTEEVFYRFETCRGSNYKPYSRKLSRLTFQVPRRSDLPAGERAIREAEAIAAGVNYAKDLGNLPGNICTPTYLAEQAESLAKNYRGIKTKVLDEAEMEKLGMGSLLAVSRGSRQPAKLIVMEYMQGPKNAKPTVLVGKGLTFDSGGISIKPGATMDEMKYDMCGGASVFGAMKAAAELELPMNLVGVVPSSENLPDGDAVKPGDILTSMSGQTIEILNTDAEGRLILCDALTYVEKNYQSDVVVDMATLTGAAVIALGSEAAALYANNSSLRRALRDAGDSVGDRAWPMPLWEEYQSQLDSNFADMANVGGRAAGSITAASFLHRFARKLRWAHLDIAGVAWKTGKDKGATGRPVGLLTEFLIARANAGQ